MPYCFSRSYIQFQGHTAKKTSILTQIRRFRTLTPIWIHQWLRNDAKTSSSIDKVFYCFLGSSIKFLSVCPSVCLSVTPFWLCSHHRIIMKFSGVITNDQSKVHAKGLGQRSKVKVTEVTTQLNSTVTPVWIHIWWWNDAYSFMLLRRGALLFFKVIRQI